MSEQLRAILSHGLDRQVRRGFDRLVDALLREHRYLEETDSAVVRRASAQGWTADRVRVVLVVNAFHRIVIGPLEAAYTTQSGTGLGNRIPITHGLSLRIDNETGAPIRGALKAYHRLLVQLSLNSKWLSMVRASDIMFSMGADEDQDIE